MNLNWSIRSTPEAYEFTETDALDEDCSLSEFQDTFILENADLAKLKMPGELLYSWKFSPQTSQRMMLNLVRDETLGCSLYIGSETEYHPCFVVFDKIRLGKSTYQINQNWHGFMIKNFLTEAQMDKMVDKNDDNILKIHISLSVDLPFSAGTLMQVDKVMVDQYEVTQMPFFDDFIKHAINPAEFESTSEDSNVNCLPDSPFNHMRKMFSVNEQEKCRAVPVSSTSTAASDLSNRTSTQQVDTSVMGSDKGTINSLKSEDHSESVFSEERVDSTAHSFVPIINEDQIQDFEQQADDQQTSTEDEQASAEDDVSVKEPSKRLYVRKKSKKFIPRIFAEFLEFLTRRSIMVPL